MGGHPGYEDFLEAYGDPAHAGPTQYREWAGDGFEAAALDIDEVNSELAGLRII